MRCACGKRRSRRQAVLWVEQFWKVHPRELDREIFADRENWQIPAIEVLRLGASSEPTEIVLGQNRLNCLASTDRLHKFSKDFLLHACILDQLSSSATKNRALLGNARVNYFRAIPLYGIPPHT